MFREAGLTTVVINAKMSNHSDMWTRVDKKGPWVLLLLPKQLISKWLEKLVSDSAFCGWVCLLAVDDSATFSPWYMGDAMLCNGYRGDPGPHTHCTTLHPSCTVVHRSPRHQNNLFIISHQQPHVMLGKSPGFVVLHHIFMVLQNNHPLV